MSKDFNKAVAERRTYYAIGKDSPVSDDRITEIVADALKYAPSSFNSQSGRAIVVFEKEHEAFWGLVKEALRAFVPADSFGQTEAKIDSFAAGHGTVLYFEDQAVVKSLQEGFPLYAGNFPVWSEQGSGMIQFIVWTALEAEGLGASLQHYSEVVDAQVKERYNIPAEWKFVAQMPFGAPVATPDEKNYLPIEDRLKVYR